MNVKKVRVCAAKIGEGAPRKVEVSLDQGMDLGDGSKGFSVCSGHDKDIVVIINLDVDPLPPGTIPLGCESIPERNKLLEHDKAAKAYREAYRAGWNDGIEVLVRGLSTGLDEGHWLTAGLRHAAKEAKRK